MARISFFIETQSTISSLVDIVHKVELLPDSLNKIIAIKKNQGTPCEGEKKTLTLLSSLVETSQSIMKPPVAETKQQSQNTETYTPEVPSRRAGFHS